MGLESLTKTKSGINPKELKLALAESAECACGLECDCYGFLALPNWNSSTGVRTNGYAVYVVDGAIKVDTIANAKVEIDGYKAL